MVKIIKVYFRKYIVFFINLCIIQNNPSVTQFELSNILQLSTKAIEKHIKNLKEDGIIRRVGPDNGGHWEVINDKNTSV